MDDRLIMVNEAFTRLYGYTPGEVIGQSIALARSDKTPEAVARQILPATLAGGWQGETLEPAEGRHRVPAVADDGRGEKTNGASRWPWSESAGT